MGLFTKLFGIGKANPAIPNGPVPRHRVGFATANADGWEVMDEPIPEPTPPLKDTGGFDGKTRSKKAADRKRKKLNLQTMLNTQETRAALIALTSRGDVFPGFRTRMHGGGLALALPDGRAIDLTSTQLHYWSILGSDIMGDGYYPAGSNERTDGQQVFLKREPKNEHDPNAVALMARPRSAKIGYVSRYKAVHVAEAMDNGIKFVAHVVGNGDQVVITTADTWQQMNG